MNLIKLACCYRANEQRAHACLRTPMLVCNCVRMLAAAGGVGGFSSGPGAAVPAPYATSLGAGCSGGAAAAAASPRPVLHNSQSNQAPQGGGCNNAMWWGQQAGQVCDAWPSLSFVLHSSLLRQLYHTLDVLTFNTVLSTPHDMISVSSAQVAGQQQRAAASDVGARNAPTALCA